MCVQERGCVCVYARRLPAVFTGKNRGISGGFIPPQGYGDISHGNGPILDVPGKYEGLHAQRVTRPKYGVFSKNNYPRKQGVFPCANGWPFQSRPGNKTQDFAKYVQILGGVAVQTRNGHGEHLRNHDGNRDGSGGLTPCFWPGEPAPPEPLKLYGKNLG